jgi:PPM family protein phosphatase
VLQVAEQASGTDTGRQRNANEDAYFAHPPLFGVADGMGGAQAGEVASKLAAESFDAVTRGEESPEAYLRAIAKTANARIHRVSQADESRSGMGTTLTAALVEDDEVGFVHVGDSRAYLYRDDRLKLLTSDHSLVEELRRQGRLTDEQAEDHPQRSIITRALGPERDVNVDTMTHQARPGDVYLLCSDGLTTMVREERIAEVLGESDDLDQAVSRLIDEANEAGGRDNITVVAFRLEEAEVAAPVADGATLVGPSAEEEGLTAESLAAAAEGRRADGEGAPPEIERRPDRRRRVRTAAMALIVVAISAALAAAAVWGVRQVYFLGTDSGGRLALYRGLPYVLPLNIELYSEVYSAPVQVKALPAARRSSATDHTLRFHSDAVSLLRDLERTAERPASVRLPAKRSGANGSRGNKGGTGNKSHGARGGGSGGTGGGQATGGGTG